MTDTHAVAAQQKHPLVVLRERLEARSGEIKAALPGIPPERFIRAVVTAAQINPDILTCQFASVWLACMRACRDGLLPDGVEGAIVAYKEKATWIPMYRGLLRKFQESGQYKWVTANVVFEGEPFEHWIDEYGEHLKHVPDEIFDDRMIRKAYAMASTKDGGIFIAVMPRAEIDKIRRVSRATREDAPWNMWFSEMAKKTALRRLSKTLPTAPLFEDEEITETEEAPQLKVATATAASRPSGAAAALDLFAGSPEESSHQPAESSSATGETGGGGSTAAGETARTETADSAATADVSDTDNDPVLMAKRRGADAKAAGQQRKSLPAEYRTPERQAEADAWLDGWEGKA